MALLLFAILLWPICPQRNDKTFLQEVEDLRDKWQTMLSDIADRQDDYHLALKNNMNKFTGYLKEGDFVYYFLLERKIRTIRTIHCV